MRIDTRRTLTTIACIGFQGTLIYSTDLNAAEALIEGFTVEEYATGLGSPTCLAFAPDGMLFVGDRNGTIHIVQQGTLRPSPFATIDVHDFFESGLLNIVVSPTYETDRFVYVFASISPEEQNIIRLRVDNHRGVDRTVIRDNLPSNGTFHNGGGLAFGPDGKLYFSIGDNGTPDNAQSITTLAGKIARINPDGATPGDNPFTTPNGVPRAAFALGFRNTFRFCFDEAGQLFSTDVGSDGAGRREEINLVTRGGNYGWPIVEGFADGDSNADGFTDPVFQYVDEGSSPTAILSYSGSHYPAEFSGDLFQMDYARNRIFRMTRNGDQLTSHSLFVRADGGAVDMVQGPDGALYYCELIGGRVMRIRYGDDPSQLIQIGGIEFTDEDDSDDDDDDVGEQPGPEEMMPAANCATGLPFFFVMMMVSVSSIGRFVGRIRSRNFAMLSDRWKREN